MVWVWGCLICEFKVLGVEFTLRMSERTSVYMDSVAIKPVEANLGFVLKDTFADLPVAPGVDLNRFSALVSLEQQNGLREKVVNRYQDIFKLRQSKGLYGRPEINTEMAIAILDDDTFKEILEEINHEGFVITVATHELGHAAVASALGWHVNSMTVVPASSYLGLTVTSPGGEKSLSDWAIESAAISFGGALAAKMAGHEVRGHGADMASAAAKARIAMADPNCPFSSEGQILSYAQNLAHSALARAGTSGIHKMALDLADKKTIV